MLYNLNHKSFTSDVMLLSQSCPPKTDLIHDIIIRLPVNKGGCCSEIMCCSQCGFCFLLNYWTIRIQTVSNETVTLVKQEHGEREWTDGLTHDVITTEKLVGETVLYVSPPGANTQRLQSIHIHHSSGYLILILSLLRNAMKYWWKREYSVFLKSLVAAAFGVYAGKKLWNPGSGVKLVMIRPRRVLWRSVIRTAFCPKRERAGMGESKTPR